MGLGSGYVHSNANPRDHVRPNIEPEGAGGTRELTNIISKKRQRVKNISVLRRDNEIANELKTNALFSLGGGEQAIKRAAGELNWRNIQAQQAKLENENRKINARREKESHRVQQRSKLLQARRAKREIKREQEAAQKARSNFLTMEAVTSKPRIDAAVRTTQELRRQQRIAFLEYERNRYPDDLTAHKPYDTSTRVPHLPRLTTGVVVAGVRGIKREMKVSSSKPAPEPIPPSSPPKRSY